MNARRSSLTGSWSGAYQEKYGRETVFNAQIDEDGGGFTGTTEEPNLLEPHLNVSVLTANIAGARSGSVVTFTKTYTGAAAVGYTVRYKGTVNGALTRIEGGWRGPPGMRGTFFMTRDDDGEAAEAEEAAEIVVEAVR